MDTFKTSMTTALSQSFAIQKEMAAFSESQVKLAQSQISSGFDAWRSTFAASRQATDAMNKVWLDALRAETKAA